MSPSDSFVKPLIYIDASALFYIMEKGPALQLQPDSGKIGVEARLLNDDPETVAGTELMEQDGIRIFVSREIQTSTDQQINIYLKKGWIGNKLDAKIVPKQTVPGFMGTRGC